MTDYVWYASYGSNLSENRFLSYILGTVPNGGTMKEVGCRDQSLPKDMKNILLPYPMFFAKKAGKWDNKGVCFIGSKPQPDEKTLGKMYLITREQFIDVVRQENSSQQLEIEFNAVERDGYQIISKTKFYGRVLLVGFENHAPIYTFTSPNDIPKSERTSPAVSYLRVIARGIKDSYGMDVSEIVDYFLERPEVQEEYTKEKLLKYLSGNK